jgi:hypothetical protein
MGNEVYLCLSVLKTGTMAGGFMAFLLMAEDDTDASATSDLFIDCIETMGDPDSSAADTQTAQSGLLVLRRRCVLVHEDREIRALSKALAANFPGISQHLMTHIGCVVLLRVCDDEGFPADTQRMLRSRMAKHHVAASLSVDLI